MRRLGRWARLGVVAAACALSGGCRGAVTPQDDPGTMTRGAPPRVATPVVPVYEGCYVAFDLPAAPAETATAAGVLALQLAADPQSMGAFNAIEVEMLDCAGANRGAVRDVGWARVGVSSARATLDVATGTAVTVAEGPLPAGSWDRVFVAVPRAWGVAADGARTALETHVEPIARGFVLPPGGRVTVAMQLTTRARPAGWNGGWNLFTKDAWLIGDEALGP